MLVFWDSETNLIAPGLNAPPMVCLSAVVRSVEGDTSHLMHWTQAGAFLKHHLTTTKACFVGANIAYDWCVACAQFPELLPHVLQAYREKRVEDIQIRQKLIDIASGCFRGYLHSKTWKWVQLNYSLADLTRRHTNKELDKDTWRLRYGELRNLPISEWPEGAVKYATEDAESTRDVWDSQERLVGKTPHIPVLKDQHNQAAYDFALKLTSTWGLRTDADAVDELETKTRTEYDRLEDVLIYEGLIRSDTKRTRNTKAAKARMLEVCGWRRAEEGEKGPNGVPFIPTRDDARPMHLTDGGEKKIPDVSLSKEACDDCEDPILKLYGELGELKSVLSKDISMLRAGAVYPIHTKYDFAWSGRTTSSKPNVQNPRRLPGIREAFRPREGWAYAQADYEGLELATLAQTCIHVLGWSTLADAINGGLDAHTAFACHIIGIPYEEGVRRRKLPKESAEYKYFDDVRQTAKVANFGFPGGLGAKTFVLFAKALYGVIITLEESYRLRELWLSMWKEMPHYFDWISSHLTDMDGKGTIKQVFSDRLRGRCSFTQACNTFFQGLGSDAAKYALWRVVQDCYGNPASPLFGSRPVNFVHDEIILETRDTPQAHDVAMELERVMISAAKEWLPDIRVAAPPLLMRRWSKEAKATYGADGRLIPWG